MRACVCDFRERKRDLCECGDRKRKIDKDIKCSEMDKCTTG